jgi:branched-chain amino acid transport system substrate-binding protein
MINVPIQRVLGLMVASAAAAASAQSTTEIKIGVINPTTGMFSVLGESARKGMDLALERAKQNPALKEVTFKVTERDSAGKVPEAIRFANELIERENVDVLMGGQSSAECLALQKLVTEVRITYITLSGCWADEFSDASNVSKYAFRVTAPNKQRNHAFANWLVKNRGTRWYVVYADYLFGQSGFKAFSDAMKAAGGTVVGSVAVPPGTTDMAPYISKINTSAADGVYFVMAGRDAVIALQEAASQGLAQKIKIAGMQSVIVPESFPTLPKSAEGLAYIGAYPRDMSGPLTTAANREFRAAYKAKFPKDDVIGLNALEAYQATNVLLAGIAKSGFRGRKDTDKLVSALSGLAVESGLDFPAGSIQIRSSDHQGVSPLYVVVIKDGAEQVLHTVPAADIAKIN